MYMSNWICIEYAQLPGGGDELFCARGKSTSRRAPMPKDQESNKGVMEYDAENSGNASQMRVLVFLCPGIKSRISDMHIKYQ